MRSISILFSFLGIISLGIAVAQGQEKQLKKAPVEHSSEPGPQFYRRNLGIDSLKALQVSQIQKDYKQGIGVLMRDSSLTEEGRRAKVRELMEAKNAKLRKILDPSQQNRMIPVTEWTVRPGEEKEKRVIKP